MIICKQCKHLHDIGDKCISKFGYGYWEGNGVTVQDAKCFNCKYFLGCNEAGDVLCKKDDGVLQTRNVTTIRKCNLNKWYKEVLA